MLRVYIGVRHTCGFTNDSLGEHFCNGNMCSFPLMVRCVAVLLYLEIFNMERSLTLKEHPLFVVSLGFFFRPLPYVISNQEL